MTATNVIALPQKDDEPTPEELRALSMNLVAWIRRNVRDIVRRREQFSYAARVQERAARVMRAAGNPFDQNRIEVREFNARELRNSASDCRQLLQEAGRHLIDIAPMIDAVLSLAQRCDLLNINVADRADLTDEDGFVKLIHVHNLEDSAFFRGKEDWDFDGPLNAAMMQVFMAFLCNHPEGQKLGDSLFERGGMFESVPMYRRLPDGSMERMPPRLQVIEAKQ